MMTKDKIAEVLLSKARSRSPDKMTVQELTGSCKISRQTFYKYFHDIIDVMQWSFERELNRVYNDFKKIKDTEANL